MTIVQRTQVMVDLEGLQLGVDDTEQELSVGCSGVGGWYDGPGVRTQFEDRQADHGSFDGPVYRSARVITPNGWATARSRSAVMAWLHRFTGTLAEGQLGTITVTDPDYGTLNAKVRLSDKPMVEWVDDVQAFKWQFSVTAPDPRLYGDLVTASTGLPAAGGGGMLFPLFVGSGLLGFGGTGGSSGKVTLSNSGTAEAQPVFTIAGPVIGGVSLKDVDSGNSIVWASDVPGGATLLIIDSANGRATLQGSGGQPADRTGELTRFEWWSIPAGGSSTIQFATLGASGQAGTLLASIKPSYW